MQFVGIFAKILASFISAVNYLCICSGAEPVHTFTLTMSVIEMYNYLKNIYIMDEIMCLIRNTFKWGVAILTGPGC